MMEQIAGKDKLLNEKTQEITKLKESEGANRDQYNRMTVELQSLKKELDKKSQ